MVEDEIGKTDCLHGFNQTDLITVECQPDIHSQGTIIFWYSGFVLVHHDKHLYIFVVHASIWLLGSFNSIVLVTSCLYTLRGSVRTKQRVFSVMRFCVQSTAFSYRIFVEQEIYISATSYSCLNIKFSFLCHGNNIVNTVWFKVYVPITFVASHLN